jgi:hypothetical protein
MIYIITVIISLIIGFILGVCVIINLTAQVEYSLIRDVRSEALKCGNGLIQLGMFKALRMLGLEEEEYE